MLRIGLLGCGRHGERYLRHLAAGDVAGATATAVWRRDAVARERLQNDYDVAVVASARDLVERDDVDAVVIATPPGSHRQELELCLAAGKPVLVEKPVTTTLADALAMVERWSDGPSVMVAQTLRYNPTLRAARDLLPELGGVHRVRMAQRLEPSPLAWQREATAAGGGSLHLTGVHLFDTLRWFFGRTPDDVQCMTESLQGHPFENLFDACFRWRDRSLLAATEVSKFSQSRSSTLDVVGEAGQLIADYARGTLTKIVGTQATELSAPGDAPTVPAILADFARVAAGEIPSPITLADGAETLRMIEACRRSASSGSRVELTELAAVSK